MIIENMVELLKASDLFVPLADPNLEFAKKHIISKYEENSDLDRELWIVEDEIKVLLVALWNDEGIRENWEQHRSQIQIQESLAYYMQEADRVLSADLKVTQLDWLHAHVRSCGVVVEEFQWESINFKVFDVGGFRTERRKWIPLYEDVTAVVYVSAISEYDELLFEDPDMNRMQESLDLFDIVVNNETLIEADMILFMNKSDIFKRKIAQIPIKNVDPDDPTKTRWEDYTGPSGVGLESDSEEFAVAYEAATKYFVDKFQSLNRNPSTRGKRVLR